MSTLTTVYGANATKMVAVPPQMLAVNENYGRVRYLYDSYTIPAGDELGTSGLVKMMRIPAGARIIDAQFAATSTGSAGICDIGWSAGATGAEALDADGLFAGQDPGAAAITGYKMLSTSAGWNKTFSEEVQVQLDFSEATVSGAGAVLELGVWIVVD